MNIRDLLLTADFTSLEHAFKIDPTLVNEEISLVDNPVKAHPLHRICDGVFNRLYSEEKGLDLAKLFLKYGSNLNVEHTPGNDSPLTAACSLRCDQLAILYIEQGANINHKGCHGGTALHWAAWCGRDAIVEFLMQFNLPINELCIDFKSTPLFWALHGYRSGGTENRHHQLNCARILLKHGANPSIPNFEGFVPKQLVKDGDEEFAALFSE